MICFYQVETALVPQEKQNLCKFEVLVKEFVSQSITILYHVCKLFFAHHERQGRYCCFLFFFSLTKMLQIFFKM